MRDIFHNDKCACFGHSNDHKKTYISGILLLLSGLKVKGQGLKFVKNRTKSRDLPICVTFSLCGGYLYANIRANAIVILNNRIQCWCLGEKRTGKLILTFFKKWFKTTYPNGYAGPCRVKAENNAQNTQMRSSSERVKWQSGTVSTG